MTIGLLWHFTHADNPDELQRQNADQAAAIYARWRSVYNRYERLSGALRVAWYSRQRKHARRREFGKLSDHLLRDMGLQRFGADTVGARLPDGPDARQLAVMRNVQGHAPQGLFRSRRECPAGDRSSQPAHHAAGSRCEILHLPTPARKLDITADQRVEDPEHTTWSIDALMAEDDTLRQRAASE